MYRHFLIILFTNSKSLCRDPEKIMYRKECINKINSLLDSCVSLSDKELFKSISNVLVKINAELCGADDIKVNSTITKIVAARSEKGLECENNNWNHVRIIFISLNIHNNLRNKIRFFFAHYQQSRKFLKTIIYSSLE